MSIIRLKQSCEQEINQDIEEITIEAARAGSVGRGFGVVASDTTRLVLILYRMPYKMGVI